MGIHDIDAASWLLADQRPVRVYATGHRHLFADYAPDVDTTTTVVEYSEGAATTIQLSRQALYGQVRR